MTKKVVLKKAVSTGTPGGGGGNGTRSRPSPRVTQVRSPASGGWLKWLFIVGFAVIAIGVFAAYRATTQARRPAPTAAGTWPPEDYGRDDDPITRSMGGASMKEWCETHEKDNKMVQERRARRQHRATGQ